MSTKPVSQRYYPALSELITVDDLPDFLQFAETGLENLLNRIHYKNFQFSKSARGDSAFYSLEIVTNNLGLDLPFGLRLVLNPSADDVNISSFPISLQYQWELLAFLRSFKLQNFAFTPEAFFQLGLRIFKITEAQVIAQTLNYFVESDEGTDGKFQELIDAVNNYYPAANLSLPTGEEPTVEIVSNLIANSPAIPDSVAQVMFLLYVLRTDLAETKRNLEQFYALMVPDGIENYIRKLLKPKLRTTLTLSAAIEFPNNILKPVTQAGVPIPNTRSLFKFAEATFYADTEAGIGSDITIAGSLLPAYPEVLHQIGNTGLTLNFNTAKLDLSRTTNIPEADAAGYPADFTGLYAKQVVLGLHRFGAESEGGESAQIRAENVFIGTGGISGLFALESNGLLRRDFGKFKAELNLFQMEFKMGSIVHSDIKGTLTLNKFKQGEFPAVIDIQAQIKNDGNFNLTAVSQDIPPINLLNILEIKLKSLQLGKEDRGYYTEVSGVLDFTANIPLMGNVLPKGIDINKLRIWDDGSMEFEGGGSIKLSKSFPVKIGPVKLEVSNISVAAYKGKHNGVDRSYGYFSFDGMVNTGRAGINTSGNGIKYYFTIDDGVFHSFLSVDRLNIDLTIPGNVSKEKAAFILNGYLSAANPAIEGSQANTEYSGAISFSLPRMRLAGSGGMRLDPAIPAFIVDIGMELPTPILLGATGLGIYGFRGLIGQHYLPSKQATTPQLEENATWWQYYKAKSTVTKREGIEIDKFASKSGFSVGAGASIATAFDSGKIFSSKLFLLLGLPDVFLLQGQAAILRSRIGLTDPADPPFSAFISIDSNGFAAGLGVDYKLPEDGGLNGAILSLSGKMELAFFFNNASGWYLNLGKDQPESERIRARILTLFQGYAYLMISSKGFKVGAGARFDFNRSFGPVALGLGAWLDMGGSLSFKPIQIGAFIQVGGYVYLKVWKAKISLSVQLGLAVDAPHPFVIQGSIRISFKVIFVKFNINLELTWRFNSNDAPLRDPQRVINLPDDNGYLPVAATNVLSGDIFNLNYFTLPFTEDYVDIPTPQDASWKYSFSDPKKIKQITLPLDSFIDIELLKAVKPSFNRLGGGANQLPEGYSELMPPQRGLSPQISHEYHLRSIDIYCWDESTLHWKPYNIYEAVTAIVKENIDPHTGLPIIDLSNLKIGYWQFAQPNRYNKIRLLSQNMFSFNNQSVQTLGDLDGLNFRRKDLFCFENLIKQHFISWKTVDEDTVYPDGTVFDQGGSSFSLYGVKAKVSYDADYEAKDLLIETYGGKITISIPVPVSTFKIEFGKNENNIKVDFIKQVRTSRPDFNSRFIKIETTDVHMQPVYVERNHDQATVVYSDLNNPITKVEITFEKAVQLNFEGDLNLGRYSQLPLPYAVSEHVDEKDKALVYFNLFNKAFDLQEVIAKGYNDSQGIVASWLFSSNMATTGNLMAIPLGSPDLTPGYFRVEEGIEQMSEIYHYTSKEDALIVPYKPVLKVEEGNFALETTVVFNPFNKGIATLFSKLEKDELTGSLKGYTLHLLQEDPVYDLTVYTENTLPVCAFYFTCYNGQSHSGYKVSTPLTVRCDTQYVEVKQYKNILVSVNRQNDLLEIFIDKEQKLSIAIPNELKQEEVQIRSTRLKQLSYLTEELQRRQAENDVTEQRLISEIQLMGDGLSKTIQPVWRPNTTYAIAVKTRDVVSGNVDGSVTYTQVYGFKTAGPIGHFHQQSSVYDKLAAEDRGDEFKLTNLKNYIDYERSYPDAQSRHDLSKPVFYHLPKIRLLFNQPYIYAMYENFDSYQGLPEVKSSLEMQVIDNFGTVLSPALVWEQLPDKEINKDNFRSLPADQQIIFLMNLAASGDSCNASPLTINKRTKQGSYQLPDLYPNKLYTAVFNSKYQPQGLEESVAEVHRFSFITSRFSNFEEQAGSFIINDTPGEESYAIYPLYTAFTANEISNEIKVLLNSDPINAPEAVMRYAVKYDRIIYGGLKIKHTDKIESSVFNIIINIEPDTQNKCILGLLVRNPEPFNDPKLPEEPLKNTVQMKVTEDDETVIEATEFLYIHSRDTSAVFITNTDMELPVGEARLTFRYKMFNGENYETEYEEYTTPQFILNK